MGYILPITLYQSMQYANIQLAKSQRYSYIGEVEHARAKSRFEKELARRMERMESKMKYESVLGLPTAQPIIIKEPEVKTIAEVTGKGNLVNSYV